MRVAGFLLPDAAHRMILVDDEAAAGTEDAMDLGIEPVDVLDLARRLGRVGELKGCVADGGQVAEIGLDEIQLNADDMCPDHQHVEQALARVCDRSPGAQCPERQRRHTVPDTERANGSTRGRADQFLLN